MAILGTAKSKVEKPVEKPDEKADRKQSIYIHTSQGIVLYINIAGFSMVDFPPSPAPPPPPRDQG